MDIHLYSPLVFEFFKGRNDIIFLLYLVLAECLRPSKLLKIMLVDLRMFIDGIW